MSQPSVIDNRETARFRATAGTQHGFGATPQDALAALMSRLPNAQDLPIVIWPYNHGDAYFSEGQQARLQELKNRAPSLTADERQELEGLVASAFEATVARTQSLPLVKS